MVLTHWFSSVIIIFQEAVFTQAWKNQGGWGGHGLPWQVWFGCLGLKTLGWSEGYYVATFVVKNTKVKEWF